jgi:5-oxoprolinase (ATP-hydrolysing)
MDIIDSVTETEFMDDGTAIRLKLTIDRNMRNAVFDFSGTGHQVLGNTNIPYSVTMSAIIYCLRCMVNKEIPLNEGCLKPIQVIIPENSILNPSEDAAIVGGNVLTS